MSFECQKTSNRLGPKTKDLTGQKFNRLTVLGFSHYHKSKWGNRAFWRFKCDCGNEIISGGPSVVAGQSKSCGCLQKEAASNSGKKMKTHGHSSNGHISMTYKTWASMIMRTQDRKKLEKPNKYYGIPVSSNWLKFDNFLKDMGERPSRLMTLDRIDNSKGYSKENCRWADKKTQARNRSSNISVTRNGKTQCVLGWCEDLGLKPSAVYMRIRRGQTPAKALGL